MIWLLWGCFSKPALVSLVEVYDVPPPPGALTLRLGPSKALQQLQGRPGEVRFLQNIRVELVDVEGAAWTVYVPQADAERWLDRGSIEL